MKKDYDEKIQNLGKHYDEKIKSLEQQFGLTRNLVQQSGNSF